MRWRCRREPFGRSGRPAPTRGWGIVREFVPLSFGRFSLPQELRGTSTLHKGADNPSVAARQLPLHRGALGGRLITAPTGAGEILQEVTMGKHAIGGMRSMIVPNRKADMRYMVNAYLRKKERSEGRNKERMVGCDKSGSNSYS